jgi:hypothetical protein
MEGEMSLVTERDTDLAVEALEIIRRADAKDMIYMVALLFARARAESAREVAAKLIYTPRRPRLVRGL